MADHQDLPAGQAYTARIDVRINSPRESVRSSSLLHDNRLPLKSLQMCHCWEPQKLLAVAEVLQAHVEDLQVAMQQLLTSIGHVLAVMHLCLLLLARLATAP